MPATLADSSAKRGTPPRRRQHARQPRPAACRSGSSCGSSQPRDCAAARRRRGRRPPGPDTPVPEDPQHAARRRPPGSRSRPVVRQIGVDLVLGDDGLRRHGAGRGAVALDALDLLEQPPRVLRATTAAAPWPAQRRSGAPTRRAPEPPRRAQVTDPSRRRLSLNMGWTRCGPSVTRSPAVTPATVRAAYLTRAAFPRRIGGAGAPGPRRADRTCAARSAPRRPGTAPAAGDSST